MDRKEAQRASAVPVTATQGAEARNWSWVEASVWTERMVSALENGVKGGRWYSLMDKVMAPATLEAAWDKVQANGGAAGVDRQSIERFDARAELYLAELSTALRDGSYRPQPIRRVEIPKGEGKTRPLGIPTVKDRIVQTAVKFALEPIFEAKFRPTSYGFRPRRGCRDALREVAQLIEAGHTFVVDADFESYFDTIAHDRLMQRVEERVSDGRLLDLLRGWLKQDIMHDLQRWTPTEGTPQGAVISPLLANIYLHPLDELMAARGYRMVRYADDFVVLCKSREEADAALAEIRAWVAENGLRLHPNKTHIGDCRQPGEGSGPPQGQHPGADAANARAEPRAHHRRPQLGAERLVRVLQACAPPHLYPDRQVHPQAASLDPAQADEEAVWLRTQSGYPSALAQRLLRSSRAARTPHGLADRETLPMRKLPTGEPYAGKPPVRFGGRGG